MSKTQKQNKPKLYEIVEKNLDLDVAHYNKFIIGSALEGQIVCLKDPFANYIAIINPQDKNTLFFADEFPYDQFSEHVGDQIDLVFRKFNLGY